MKSAVSIAGTVVVLVSMVLGVLVVFEVIDFDTFGENMGKVALATLIVTLGGLLILALNQEGQPRKRK